MPSLDKPKTAQKIPRWPPASISKCDQFDRGKQKACRARILVLPADESLHLLAPSFPLPSPSPVKAVEIPSHAQIRHPQTRASRAQTRISTSSTSKSTSPHALPVQTVQSPITNSHPSTRFSNSPQFHSPVLENQAPSQPRASHGFPSDIHFSHRNGCGYGAFLSFLLPLFTAAPPPTSPKHPNQATSLILRSGLPD